MYIYIVYTLLYSNIDMRIGVLRRQKRYILYYKEKYDKFNYNLKHDFKPIVYNLLDI